MCEIAGVGGGVSTQMPPTKTDVGGVSTQVPPGKTDVGGAMEPPGKVADASGGGLPPTDAPSQAAAGADLLGGGPTNDLAAVLQQLIETLNALVAALSAQGGAIGGGPVDGGGGLPPAPPAAPAAPDASMAGHTH